MMGGCVGRKAREVVVDEARAFELVSCRWVREKMSSDEDEEEKATDGGLEEFMKQEPSQCKARCIHPSPGKVSENV